MEAYLAVPSMGAVLHTLNIRLFPEQLAYVINHAEDKVIIVDASLIAVLGHVFDELKTVETVIVVGEGDTTVLGPTLSYETLLAAEETGFDWPELDERTAAAMCYTSGTTGNPKGVVYSHRSTFLHTMSQAGTAAVGLYEQDRMLAIVPMFHANAWGTPYSCWMTGADMVLPQQYVQGEQLARIIPDLKPTLSCGVPTIWNDLLRVATTTEVDLSSLRSVTAGGSAVPRGLIEAFRDRFGITILQGWGMTETSPLAAVAIPPRDCPPELDMDYRVKAGRILPGVEVRTVGEEGQILPRDGESVGEFEIRGPWVTASYYQRRGPGQVPQRVAAHRRRRHHRREGVHADHRPEQGRDQVGRGVDQLGRARGRGHEPPRGLRGRRGRRARPPLAGAPAGVRGPDARGQPNGRGAPRLPPGPGGPVVAARALGLRGRHPQDLGRQVRQEGAAGPARRRRAGRDHRGPAPDHLSTPRVAVDDELAEVAGQLEDLAERLADLALDRLRAATDAEDPDLEAVAVERRITRARRSVQKAATLLAGPGRADDLDP